MASTALLLDLFVWTRPSSGFLAHDSIFIELRLKTFIPCESAKRQRWKNVDVYCRELTSPTSRKIKLFSDLAVKLIFQQVLLSSFDFKRRIYHLCYEWCVSRRRESSALSARSHTPLCKEVNGGKFWLGFKYSSKLFTHMFENSLVLTNLHKSVINMSLFFFKN